MRRDPFPPGWREVTEQRAAKYGHRSFAYYAVRSGIAYSTALMLGLIAFYAWLDVPWWLWVLPALCVAANARAWRSTHRAWLSVVSLRQTLDERP